MFELQTLRDPGSDEADELEEFLQKVKERSPDTVRIILSAHADVTIAIEAINKGEIYRFLAKPWNGQNLKEIIRECLE